MASKANLKLARKKSKMIDKQMQKKKKKAYTTINLLLLGTGGSGKSTIAKQMHILYLKGFKSSEKEFFKREVVMNFVKNTKDLIVGAKKLDIELSEYEEALSIFDEEEDGDKEEVYEKFDKVKDLFAQFWRDDAVQEAYAKRNLFQLSDSAAYFYENLDAYNDIRNYDITDEDILRVRKPTTGVEETIFKDKGLSYKMIDVGGQRNERRKWIHYFNAVSAVLFIASLSEYDTVLEEDETQNRTAEALEVFDNIINNNWFRDTPVILFLNKDDIFKEKINRSDPGKYFKDYTGGCDEGRARKYIRSLYVKRSQNKKRELFVHVTTATNTNNVKIVFDAIQASLMQDRIDF